MLLHQGSPLLQNVNESIKKALKRRRTDPFRVRETFYSCFFLIWNSHNWCIRDRESLMVFFIFMISIEYPQAFTGDLWLFHYKYVIIAWFLWLSRKILRYGRDIKRLFSRFLGPAGSWYFKNQKELSIRVILLHFVPEQVLIFFVFSSFYQSSTLAQSIIKHKWREMQIWILGANCLRAYLRVAFRTPLKI